MEEEEKTSRRNFLKYLALFLTLGAGVSIYINQNKISVEEAIKKTLNLLKIKLDEVKPEAEKITENDIDSWLSRELDKNIDKFLDWYYSIGGEIVVILYIATKYGNEVLKKLNISSDFVKEKEEELNKHFADMLFAGFLKETPNKIKLVYEKKLEEFNKNAILIFKNTDINDFRSVKYALDKIYKKTLTHVSITFSITGIVGAILLRQVISRFTRRFILKTGEKVFAKSAASRGTSLVGVICGPAAPLCIAGLAAVIEYASIKIDEIITRESFKKELKEMIISDLNKIKPKIKNSIITKVEEINKKTYEEGKKILVRDLLKS